MPEYEYRPVRKATAERLTSEYISFYGICKGEGPDMTQEHGFCIGNNSYVWDGQKWMREVRKPDTTPKPEHMVFMVYGGFSLPNGLNFFICRIPTKGVNFHKQVVPAIRRCLKSQLGLLKWESCPQWNIDGESAQPGQKTLWEVEKPQRFDFQKGEFVEVWKGTAKKEQKA